MIAWDEVHSSRIDDALERARERGPAVLVVEGLPGAGKSTILREVAERAYDFEVRTAEAIEGDAAPYATLSRFGVRPPDRVAPFVAAQSLRELVDTSARGRPVLLVLDDLQFADAETAQSLHFFVDRADGDRVLVAVGTRPLASAVHREWQDFLAERPQNRLELRGLGYEAALQVGSAIHPGLPAGVIRNIWRQTDGNPLYFTSLLTEHSPEELSAMRMLPAPNAFARDLTRRVERLGPDAVALARASAVLGLEWTPLALAAGMARVDDPTSTAETLVDQGVLEQQATDSPVAVRPAHSLVRAAIYQSIPLSERRRLHLAAAALESRSDSVLAHRVAAADTFDDALADELAASAARRHDSGAYRIAADHLRWSSQLTSEPGRRTRRLMDSLLESLLAEDVEPVAERLRELGPADPDRQALLRGMICVLQNRWVDAVRELGAVTSQPEGGPDRLVRYRAEVLSAWAGIGGGIPTPTVVGHLEAASRAGVTDPAFTGFFEFAYGEARGRTHGVAGLRAYTADLPQAPLQVPEASTYLLAFRGLTRSAAGFFPEAIADLSEVEKRFRVGLRNLGDGVSHAHLGMSLWMAGDWRLADTKFRIARDLRHEIPNPMTIALTAFEPVRRADFAAARALLDELGADLAKQPWQEAVDFFLSALVVLLHAEGDPAAQSRARAEFARTFGRQALELRDPVYPFWLVNRALLSLWAGDEADAERIVQALAGLDWKPVWARGAEHWLRGLIAEVRGLTGRARREFDDAVAGGIAEFPLLHAHVLFDRARVARDAASLQASQALYRRLGQLAYLERFSVSPETPAVVAGSALAGLSDRERDVVALLAEGFSYAQIARDLYITRSTVAFHLSNIYAKTGVTSRHALTELVRTVG